MCQSLLFKHHFNYYPDVDSHYPRSQVIMNYQYTKTVVIRNTLICKNPIPLRGHLKCSWAGKIIAQLPDGPTLCVMWQ